MALILLFTGILQKEKLDEICEEKEFYLSYPWNIANKYYEAAVDVCHVKQKNIVSQLFSSEVEAVVAVFDSKKVIFISYIFVGYYCILGN